MMYRYEIHSRMVSFLWLKHHHVLFLLYRTGQICNFSLKYRLMSWNAQGTFSC